MAATSNPIYMFNRVDGTTSVLLSTLQVPIFGTWVTSYDFAGTCVPRPAQGRACVDKALIG